jgi:hypothetical protein
MSNPQSLYRHGETLYFVILFVIPVLVNFLNDSHVLCGKNKCYYAINTLKGEMSHELFVIRKRRGNWGFDHQQT